MRALSAIVAALACACGSSTPTPVTATPDPAKEPVVSAPTQAAPAVPVPTTEVLAADTPKTTVAGNGFIAPAGWSISVRGPATILEAPEKGSFIAIVDVPAKNVDQAVELAWNAYKPDRTWPLKLTADAPDRDGWSNIRSYEYQTSPNEKRDVGVDARFANTTWTVSIYDMAQAVGSKRAGQVRLIFGRLLPKGHERESFAGKQANVLDQARIAELTKFVDSARQQTQIPGISFGLVQNGKVVFAGGVGVRELGKPAKVDGNTRYMIASNTKAMTTLMLAKLVEEKKLTWETPATELLPSFKLGDADTTSKVLVKHLICACTGMPRQDFEWLFEWNSITPELAVKMLGTMQPTSKFGELFQYSNPLAAAAGFIGGHVAFPKLELGKAYDEAMRTRVFQPLGMKATTLDFKVAQRGNASAAHSPTIGGKMTVAPMVLNTSVIPVRPAGGAWSTVRDVLAYVQMELDGGTIKGKPYLSKDTLLARRTAQVAIGKDKSYGMGLMVDRTYGVEVVHHGGDMVGFHSDMIWLPEHNVGAVILTNGDPGWLVRNSFQRKLLEVLFDGRKEADAQVAAAGKTFFDQLAAERKLLAVPADATEAGKLATSYANAALGTITVSKVGATTVFDFGEWKSEVATKRNPDGTISFVTIAPGISGIELIVGKGAKRTLVTRDAQHEYVFDER